MKPIELKESNGIKVGDIVYVSDLLYDTQGAIFILDGSTYKQDSKKTGKGKVIAIYDWNSDLSECPYMIVKNGIRNLAVSGVRPSEEEYIPYYIYEEEEDVKAVHWLCSSEE